jgi:hypothetical protein
LAPLSPTFDDLPGYDNFQLFIEAFSIKGKQRVVLSSVELHKASLTTTTR